jgi:hypothetical protein
MFSQKRSKYHTVSLMWYVSVQIIGCHRASFHGNTKAYGMVLWCSETLRPRGKIFWSQFFCRGTAGTCWDITTDTTVDQTDNIHSTDTTRVVTTMTQFFNGDQLKTPQQ